MNVPAVFRWITISTIAFAFNVCAHSMNPQKPTKTDSLEGIWVAYSSAGSARLELDKSAKGLLAIKFENRVEAFELRSRESVTHGAMEFQVTPRGDAGISAVSVLRTLDGLELQFEQGDDSVKLYLERDADLQKDTEALMRATHSMGTSP